jgi:cytochrome c oxidase subunit II
MRRFALSLALLCAGCTGWQSALAPQGPQAAYLSWLLYSFVVICTIIWLLVMLVLVLALRRRAAPDGEPHRERRAGVIVGLSVAASVLVIIVLTVMSYAATRALSTAAGDPLVIRLRGYQWWWEITYVDTRPDRTLVTANEIHVPVGRPVRVELSAADVIHSFWVPNLAGKQDLIPGRSNDLTFIADRPGVYRGQEAGRGFFTSQACGACHRVRGTSTAGTLGPDLTHVASRQTIAAGLLPTTRGSLAAWIADPQTIKPGNNMPMVPMTPDQLRAVSAWLAELK